MADTDQYERPELAALTASPAIEPEIRRWRADMLRALQKWGEDPAGDPGERRRLLGAVGVLDRMLGGARAPGAVTAVEQATP